MLSFSTPPFHLENFAASVAAAALLYLHIWNESDEAAETSAAEDGWVSYFTSVLIWFFFVRFYIHSYIMLLSKHERHLCVFKIIKDN